MGGAAARQAVAVAAALLVVEMVPDVHPVPRESLRTALQGDLLVMGAPAEAAEGTPRIRRTVIIGETESRQVTRTPAALTYLSVSAMAPS